MQSTLRFACLIWQAARLLVVRMFLTAALFAFAYFLLQLSHCFAPYPSHVPFFPRLRIPYLPYPMLEIIFFSLCIAKKKRGGACFCATLDCRIAQVPGFCRIFAQKG